MLRVWVVVGWLAGGCAHPMPPDPVLSFMFEARPTGGEIRVVPALQLYAPPAPEFGSFIGRSLPAGQQGVRMERTRQLLELSAAVGLALPGEVNGELGDSWPGQFRSHPYPVGIRQRLEDALRTGRDLDAALGEAAGAIGGDAVLISWVDQLEAEPLSLRDLPGQVVDTPAGPVVVDHADEPYVVSARVGMALVTADGEVVVRYHDTYQTVLSGARGPSVAGRDLAHALAVEVATVWAVDPRLRVGEPPFAWHTDVAPGDSSTDRPRKWPVSLSSTYR